MKRILFMALALCLSAGAFAIDKDSKGFYLIKNVADYEEFAALVNGGQTSISAHLLSDINGTSACIANGTGVPYTGVFNGNGHSVMLNINNPDDKMRGLIGCVDGGAVVMNVVVKGSVVGNGNTGGVVGGTVEKGTGTVLILNCGNEATVKGKSCTAGILGKNRSSGASDSEKVKVVMMNCYNTGAITGSEKAAAMCGEFSSFDRIFNCYNIGSTAPASSTPFGRYVDGAKFRNCWTIPSNKGSKDVTGVGVVSADDAYGEILSGLNSVTPIFVSGTTYPVLHSVALPESGVFEIGNLADLTYYAYLVKGGVGYYGAKLTADIAGAACPIGDYDNGLCADFDGQGHRVTLAMNTEELAASSDYRSQALIGSIGAGITIQNVTVDGYVYGNNVVGGIAGRILSSANGTITIRNCGNEATLYGADNVAGIIAGYSASDKNAKVVLENCYNMGQVNGNSYVVALAASLGNNAVITRCYHAGEVLPKSSHSSKPFARYDSATFTDCYSLPIGGKTLDTGITEIIADIVGSGELAYLLGSDYKQNIGTDTHPNHLDGHKAVVGKADITEYGMATYVTEGATDFTLTPAVKAYAVVYGEDSSLLASDVESAPAGTALVIEAAEGTYYLNATDEAEAPANNILLAATDDVTAAADYFMLANGDKGVGFYPVEEGTTIAKGKGYFISAVPGAKFFSIGGTATGISTSVVANDAQVIYNLAGQRVNKNAKGVVIVNGKKVIM